ncbi:MAG: tetratricopeptide repeat protein [Cyanobacteriota bacterium]
MVSNVYSNIYLPNIKTYNLNPNKKVFNGSSDSVDPDSQGKKKQPLQENSELNNNRCLNKFLTSDNPDINISDIIQDFKATMTQLGIPKNLGKQIMADLKNIHIESSLDNPSISKIQNSLYSAAKKVDIYVTEAIGQDSNFVKQWIDAILIQKINYNAYDPLPADYIEKEISKKIAEKKDLINESNLTTNNSSQTNKPISKDISPSRISVSEKQPEPNLKINNSFEINNTKDIIKETKSNPFHTTDKQPEIAPKSALPAIVENIDESLPALKPDKKMVLQNRKAFISARKEAIKNNYDKAIEMYKDVINSAKDLKDNKTLTLAHSDLAKIFDKKYDLKTSLQHYHEAIKSASNDNDYESLAKLHYNVGSIYDDLDMKPNALKHYYASIEFDGETDNLEGQALTLNDIALIYTADNKVKDAIECYKTAYSIASQIGDDEAKAHILSNMGSVYKKNNDIENALEFYRRSLKLDQDCNNLTGYTKTLINIGDIYDAFDNKDRAQKYYSKALKNANYLNDNQLAFIVQNRLNN